MEDQHGRRGWAPATYLKPAIDKGTGDGIAKTVVGEPFCYMLYVFRLKSPANTPSAQLGQVLKHVCMHY